MQVLEGICGDHGHKRKEGRKEHLEEVGTCVDAGGQGLCFGAVGG